MPATESLQNAPPSESRSRRRPWLINGVIFLVSLVLCAVLIEPWLPYPAIPVAGDKIRFLSQHGNQNDTIFIGSSRVNFQILPSVFDAALAESGKPVKSFNAGLLGMRSPEQSYFLDQVLRQPHERLRWVFVELTSFEARTPPTRRGSARYVLWHDGPRMLLLGTWLRAEWAALLPGLSATGPERTRLVHLWEPLSVWLMHFNRFCKRTLNPGRGAFIGEAWIIPPSKRAKQRNRFRSLGEHRDGWEPYDGSREVMNEKERALYLESYEARLASPAVRYHDPASDASIEAMRQAVIQAGATPIFLLPPMTSDRQYYPPPELAKKMTIWDFSDPRLYPSLFVPEHRLDFLHTNVAGGREFTRILADRFRQLPR